MSAPVRAKRTADVPLHYNLVEILERNLHEAADRLAVLSPDRELTFAEVSAEANQVTNALRSIGMKAGDTVAIVSPDCAEWATCFFGTVKAGVVALGTNTLLTPEGLRYVLHDGRARLAIVHEALLETFDQVRGELPFLEHVVVIGNATQEGDRPFSEWIADEPNTAEAALTHRDDFAILNYSSGTTGQPKGILHSHKDPLLAAELWGVNVLGIESTDRTLSVARLFFTFGLGGNLIFPWYVGAQTVLFPENPREAKTVLGMIDRFRPTILYGAPTGYAAALAVEGLTTNYDLSTLRVCVSAGEALPAALWHRWQGTVGVEIIDGIGSTENFHIFLSNRPGRIRPGSSGRKMEGYELAILDESGDPVEQGQVGNLLVKGETAALSYLHDSAKSRETFQGEWLSTGDKYYMDDNGYYWHAGRSDDMLKVGGIWVSPVEVESTLIAHDAVLECAVVGVGDRAALIKPKAYVVLNPGYDASDEMAEELTQHCVSAMEAYKRPRWIEFLQELPKTATGKIQRFKLR
ncbi:MAG: benzoate-CoA ligase family protein [Gemmatimonadetes bacterium]|nr:benzoate-CoA ligase family protein [Gemmatimonadota bacterium]